MIEIKRIADIGEDSYNDFVNGYRNSLFYYSLEFRNFISTILECEHEYLCAVHKGKITGVFPLMAKKGKFGTVFNSLPFYGSNGGILAQNQEVAESLNLEYNSLVSSSGVCSSCVISNPFTEDEFSYLHEYQDERIGQSISITDLNTEKDLFEIYDSSTRRNIRKARKSGVSVDVRFSEIEWLMQQHELNMQQIGGRKKPDDFFRNVEVFFEPGRDYKLYIAELDGRKIAGLLLFYFNKTVEYFVPAIVQKYRKYQPLPLIIHQAIMDAIKTGYQVWNWGGTWKAQEGVYRFKKKWGSADKMYKYYIHVENNDVFSSTPMELVEEYGNFYVIPYELLGRKNDQQRKESCDFWYRKLC